jgi:undecaprenyl-diphosphatase
MPLYQVIVLAIVQGLTEFLPISSTAHLYLTSWLFGWQTESLTFDIALHIGTLAAVLTYFFRDWLQILAQGLGMNYGRDAELKLNRAMLWLLVIGSIPVGVAGLLFNKQAEGPWRNPYVIAGMLIGVGVLMGVADRMGKCNRDLATVQGGDAVVIGLAQALAVVPGTSRSGITITAGLFRNLDREAAARFSFLLSTPAIAAAAAKALHDLQKQGGIPAEMRLAFGVGVGLSAVVGFVVIAFFLRYLKRNSLTLFVYYRIIFGIIVLALAFFRPPAG